ncbi:MAG: NAD(P)/FAD-dependent oxidoreductase, partial [Alphaproteobacteria bacterium]|nr:NAD(P)/FAD-dependent oxidoreductase [Alphaproteobacteria bacterium]
TWYWNRYPGARCDVESMQYSYSFSDELQQEWHWSEKFSAQPEILEYANHVADRFDLRRDMQFETTVESAIYDESTQRWHVKTDTGRELRPRYLIMATGCLSSARIPDFPGLHDFTGETYHTGHWPHEGVDFTGMRVAVIGTGSSAIQAIPVIAEQAARLTVFQRTPNYSIPSRNGPMTDDYEQYWKRDYPAHRASARLAKNGILADPNDKSAMEVSERERLEVYEQRWAEGGTRFMAAFNDLATNAESNETAARFVRDKIRQIVHDRETAELLAARDYPIGTKRICVDTQYFETFNRDNVELVDVRNAPIEHLTAAGLRQGGKDYTFDAIVFATGFDAMTGTLDRIDIRGRDGRRLRQEWEAGPKTYLGMMSAGFPNIFMITGPQSPSVLSNMMVSIEQHVDWMADCIAHMQDRGLVSVEPEPEAQEAWIEHSNEVAYKTLYPQAASWYMGANIPGKPRVFLPYIGGVGKYREKCDEIAAAGYEGFRFESGC